MLKCKWLVMVMMAGAIWAVGCGGGSSNGTGNPGNNPIAGPAANVVTMTAGGSTQNPAGIVNGAFASASICVPGSSNCATIGGLLVDTGSSGVRILASALPAGFNGSLPQQTDTGGNPIVECAQFGDGFTWGPVKTVDVVLSSEKAGSVPIQIIADPNFSTVPAACTNAALGPSENSVGTLGANGILGVGNFIQDCGPACTLSGASNPGNYFSCPNTGCVVTTQSLANQLQQPVSMFATDNNGLIIELPAVGAGGAVVTNGSLVFGIGTQSNNGLNGATVLMLNANGNFSTTFKSTTVPGFVDTGSNGTFFLDSATTGFPMCASNTAFYCPASTQNLTATNMGTNATNTTINFTVVNADSLLSSSNPNFLLPGLAAPSPGQFDWGLPFFYGRNVFVALEGKSTPGGTGPYTAY